MDYDNKLCKISHQSSVVRAETSSQNCFDDKLSVSSILHISMPKL